MVNSQMKHTAQKMANNTKNINIFHKKHSKRAYSLYLP